MSIHVSYVNHKFWLFAGLGETRRRSHLRHNRRTARKRRRRRGWGRRRRWRWRKRRGRWWRRDGVRSVEIGRVGMLSVFPATTTTETMRVVPRSVVSRPRRRCWCRPPLPLILVLTLSLSLPTARSLPADIVQKFHDPEVERMNHLVVDKNTGRVYVGAVNRLYQLSPDLLLVVKEVTGPKGDSTACSMLDCPREAQKRPVDNVNKALVIDYTTTRLISCGSLFQGMCTVRNLHNISDVVQEVKEAVVANNATASTVAFIAPGPPNPPVSQVMYVGVTFTGNSPYRSEVPAVSSRSLDKDKMLNIAEAAVTTGTRMYVNSLSRERYPINYIYGFSSGGFSYFLTTQMKNTETPIYLSKLVRVCQDDEHYYSYTEIPINCTSDERIYNLVQAAYVGKAGSVLAGDLGITAQDDVLFAVFAESDGPNSDVPRPLSALCVYSLKAIRRKFMSNIQRCFSGEGQRGLEFISPSHKCISTVSHFQQLNLTAAALPRRLRVISAMSLGIMSLVIRGKVSSTFDRCGERGIQRARDNTLRDFGWVIFQIYLDFFDYCIYIYIVGIRRDFLEREMFNSQFKCNSSRNSRTRARLLDF